MPSIFVSLVGTQIMGTLHPRNAFLRACPGAKSIFLYTPETHEHTLRLKDWLIKKNDCSFDMLPISTSVGKEDSASAVVVRLAKEAEAAGDRIVYNVNGGMNYLIADCVIALAKYRPVFIQSSEMRSVSFDTETGCVTQLPTPEPLSVPDILDLQGVAWSTSEENSWFLEWCENQHPDLPLGCQKNLVINGVRFDLAWNPGSNRINFLKDCRWLAADSKTRLEKMRTLTHWAADRKCSAQMFDRTVYALCNNAETVHHLQSESQDKITVIPLEAEFGERTALRRTLDKVFSRKITHRDELEELKCPKPANGKPMQDGTLIVCMGTNILPTLKALLSHKHRHVILCHTKDLTQQATDFINKTHNFLNSKLESISLIQISVEGNHLEQLLPRPAEGARISINITPGTKGQAAMLTWWGYTHNCSVWSINNRTHCCTPLFAPHGEQEIKTVCDLDVYLSLEGKELLQTNSLTDEEKLHCQVLLTFMRAALDNGQDDNVMQQNVSVDGMSLALGQDKLWHFTGKEMSFSFSTKGGEWLEKLTAAALEEAGLHDVFYRVRFRWPQKIEQDIRSRYAQSIAANEEIFSQDLDVMGVYKDAVVVISCKANPQISIDEAATEIASTGERLGRFSLRFLVHMAQKDSIIYNENVMVLGWRQLCRKEEFIRLVKMLRNSLQTTEE